MCNLNSYQPPYAVSLYIWTNKLIVTVKIRLRLLSASIGIVYIMFGGLKFFPTLSPAEHIGLDTVQILTFNLINTDVSIILLALFEICIGILLLSYRCRKLAVTITACHLILTFSPLLFFPEQLIDFNTLGPSLLGQYIFKNIVLLSAVLLLFPTKEEKLSLAK